VGQHWHDYPAVLGRTLGSGRLAAIFAKLEFAGLLNLVRFAGKSPDDASSQSGRPTSVHRSGMGPASGRIHPQDLPLIPPQPTLSWGKMAP
jgi:hypothetical protein